MLSRVVIVTSIVLLATIFTTTHAAKDDDATTTLERLERIIRSSDQAGNNADKMSQRSGLSVNSYLAPSTSLKGIAALPGGILMVADGQQGFLALESLAFPASPPTVSVTMDSLTDIADPVAVAASTSVRAYGLLAMGNSTVYTSLILGVMNVANPLKPTVLTYFGAGVSISKYSPRPTFVLREAGFGLQGIVLSSGGSTFSVFNATDASSGYTIDLGLNIGSFEQISSSVVAVMCSNSNLNQLIMVNISSKVPVVSSSTSYGNKMIGMTFVQPHYLVIASAGSSSLQVMSVANPASPQVVSSLSGVVTGFPAPSSVAMTTRGTTIYVVVPTVGLVLVDASNPAALSLVAGGPMNISGSCESFLTLPVEGQPQDRAYVGGPAGVQVVVMSSPRSMVVQPASLSLVPMSMVVDPADPNYLYISSSASGVGGLSGIRIMHVPTVYSAGSSLVVSDFPVRDAGSMTIFTGGANNGERYVAICDGNAGVRFINVTNREAPALLSTLMTSGTPMQVTIAVGQDGNPIAATTRVYVLSASGQVVVVDASDITSPVQVSQWTPSVGTTVQSIVVSNSVMYVLESYPDNQIDIVPITSATTALTTFNSYTMSSLYTTYGIHYAFGQVIVSTSSGGRVYDVSNLNSIRSSGSWYSFSSQNMAVSSTIGAQWGSYTSYQSQISFLDMSNPSSIYQMNSAIVNSLTNVNFAMALVSSTGRCFVVTPTGLTVVSNLPQPKSFVTNAPSPTYAPWTPSPPYHYYDDELTTGQILAIVGGVSAVVSLFAGISVRIWRRNQLRMMQYRQPLVYVVNGDSQTMVGQQQQYVVNGNPQMMAGHQPQYVMGAPVAQGAPVMAAPAGGAGGGGGVVGGGKM